MNTVKGSSGLYVETVSGMPQIVIEYDRMAIARYGLSVSDINRVVNTAFAGQSSGLVYEGEQRYDLVVRLGKEQRQGIRDVQDLLLPVPGGIQIPLRSVANVQMREGPVQIQREDAQRRIIIGCNVRGRDVQSMVKEIQQKAETQLHLPPGYFIKYGGAFENLEAAKKRLFIAVPVSLVLIFLLLYFAFRSIRQGLLIYSAIPLSATGGIFALALRGMSFSISAGVGFIALFGVAVLNGIVLISEYRRRRMAGSEGEMTGGIADSGVGHEGPGTVAVDLKTIILDGTSTRLRPVLMTAFVASLGFLPMALSNGAGAEVQRPLATVVIGGLLIATLLTLFLLPLLYYLTERPHSRRKTAIPVAVFLLVLAGSLMAGQANAQVPASVQTPVNVPMSVNLQQPVPITLTAAIDSAIKNNLSLKGEKLNAAYLEKLKGTAYAIPQTNAIFEYGQMNSAYADNKVIVSQSIRFPTVYARQRSLYEQEWKNGVLNAAVREHELRKQVALLYYTMRYLQQKQQLLAYSDSLFSAFLRKATQRFNQGESNLLEKITAETQAGQIGLQVKALQQDLATARVQFKWLLHTTLDYTPVAEGSSLPEPLMADTPVWERHPFVQQLEQQQRVSEARWKLEKSRLSPDLFAAYSNMTIRGDGADGKTYSASTRFQSVQLGVGIPLFARSQKNQIAASRVSVQVADNNYTEGLQAMQAKYQEALEQYKKYSQAVVYFESSALKNADTIIRTADLQFTEGAINYLDWVLLVNNAITIRSEYIDAVRDRNQYAITVNNYFIH
jgi:cobalt-zinc-cadmium resistance protein CzcA